jgi:hypothetical protein
MSADKLQAADAIEREAKRWEGLLTTAKALREVGSLEQAAAQAEQRIANARATEQRILADLDAKRQTAEAQIADVNAHRKDAEDAIAQERANLATASAIATKEADKLISDAKAEAERIVTAAKADAQGAVDGLKDARAEADTNYEAARQRLEEIEAHVAERQEVLDHINERLAAIGAKTK